MKGPECNRVRFSWDTNSSWKRLSYCNPFVPGKLGPSAGVQERGPGIYKRKTVRWHTGVHSAQHRSMVLNIAQRCSTSHNGAQHRSTVLNITQRLNIAQTGCPVRLRSFFSVGIRTTKTRTWIGALHGWLVDRFLDVFGACTSLAELERACSLHVKQFSVPAWPGTDILVHSQGPTNSWPKKCLKK